MTWEWKIGDPVDDANGGTMDAMNWGHGSDDENPNQSSASNSDNRSYEYWSPPSPREIQRRELMDKKNSYEYKLKNARRQTNDELKIRYYGEAIECAEEYFTKSAKTGITVDGMPDRKHILSDGDIAWISKKHYDEFDKLHILSTDQTEDLENLLKKSGNAEIIKANEETRRKRNEEEIRKRGFENARNLKKDYFEHMEKANELVIKNKPKKAIKEYHNAIRDYDEFFKSSYATNFMKREMPAVKLTPQAVDNIMTVYKKTHPLLTSKKSSRKINSEIIEMLDGDWDDRLKKADSEVLEILEAKKREREKKIEMVEDVAVDVIVGARIVGNSILNRLKR